MTSGNTSALTRDPALTGDPQAGPFLARAEEKLESLRDLVVRVAAGLSQFRRAIAGADTRAEQEARQSALDELERIQGGAEAVRQGIILLYEDALGPVLPSSPAPDEEEEATRRDDAWERQRAELDAMDDAGALQRAVESMADVARRTPDKTTLLTLRDRLPAYMESRGMADLAPRLVARVDEVAEAGLSPVERAARLVQRTLDAGWPRVLASIEAARAEVSGRGEPVATLPGFGPDEQVPVGE